MMELPDRLSHTMKDLISGLQVFEIGSYNLSQNEAIQVMTKIFDSLVLYQQYGKWPVPPFNSDTLKDLEKEAENLLSDLQSIIDKSKIESLSSQIHDFFKSRSKLELNLLQGMRITSGSIDQLVVFPNIPSLKLLATEKYNEFLTQIARARAKHSLRCEISYWGEIQGSPKEQNTDAEKFLTEMLENFTWWNMYGHFKHEKVFEIRDKTGHGMRWELENEKFLGFVEPVDPNLGRKFFKTENFDKTA